jgi:hypothetical protein
VQLGRQERREPAKRPAHAPPPACHAFGNRRDGLTQHRGALVIGQVRGESGQRGGSSRRVGDADGRVDGLTQCCWTLILRDVRQEAGQRLGARGVVADRLRCAKCR